MKSSAAIVAVASLASAALVERDVVPYSATASLLAALPASILSVALTNQASASALIFSELSDSTKPAWFASLPAEVQTYFITSAGGGPISISLVTIMSIATTTKPTSSNTSTATPNPTHDSGISGGAIAGIIIGALLFAALIGTLLLFWLRRKKRTRQAQPVHADEKPAGFTSNQTYNNSGPSELSSHSVWNGRSELSASPNSRAELAARY